MSNDTKYRLAWLSMGFLFSMFMVGFYMSVAPYQTIRFFGPYEFPEVVRKGENTHYTVRYCKYTDVMPTIEKYYVDGIQYKAEETKAILTKGCHETKVPIHIPETLPAGKYKLRIIATYKINPLRTIIATNESNWFEVKE